MSPSAANDAAAQPTRTYPSVKVYPVKEARFDKFIPPQADGHETAKTRPADTTAIVIDNGIFF